MSEFQMLFQRLALYLGVGGLVFLALISLLHICERVRMRLRLQWRRGSRANIVCFVLSAAIATVCAQKGGNSDGDANGAPPRMMAPRIMPTALDVDDLELPIVSNLCISAIEPGSNSVAFSISWPVTMPLASDGIDLFATWDLLHQPWFHLAEVDITGATSNAVVEIAHTMFPTNAMAHTAFYRIASQLDSDGDGLSDAEEELVWMTNPYSVDTDGDGINDKWEVEYNTGSNDDFLDADGDELPDAYEIEIGTNPNNSDTDGDLLCDKDELCNDSDPCNSDTDGDGLTDYEEMQLGTNLNSPDQLIITNDDSRLSDGAFTIAFPTTQGNTSASGADYEMLGTFDVDVIYDQNVGMVPGFNILGVCPPGGHTTRSSKEGMEGVWYDQTAPNFSNAFQVVISGATFRPLKTGRYYFQIYADDHATNQIDQTEMVFSPFSYDWNPVMDGLSVTADFYGDNPVTSMVFIAGRDYSVEIHANSIGGPAKFEILKWAEFEPILKPRIDAAFSSSVVIFEDAYRSVPKLPLTERRSTQTCYNLQMLGGGLGGVLQITTQNKSCLHYVGGDGDCLDRSYMIAPGENFSIASIYEGVAPSSTTNDIVVVAKFTEDKTGEMIACTNRLTALKVELTEQSVAPKSSDVHRHIFGPLEVARVDVHPVVAGAVLSVDGVQSSGSAFSLITNVVTMSSRPGDAVLNISYGGVDYQSAIRVIPPSGCVSISCRAFEPFDFVLLNAEPDEWWCGMVNELEVVPKFVSFQYVRILEDMCDATLRSGFFKRYAPKSHDYAAGARKIVSVDNGNLGGYDYAGYKGVSWDGCSSGGFVWKIPCYWNTDVDDDNVWRGMRYEVQRFWISSDGLFSVEKYGRKMARDINGVSHEVKIGGGR